MYSIICFKFFATSILVFYFLSTAALAGNPSVAVVYFKDGTEMRGGHVWHDNDKVYLNKNGELWEFDKSEVILEKTIKTEKIAEKSTTYPHENRPREWSTVEAYKAFGKPGDTIKSTPPKAPQESERMQNLREMAMKDFSLNTERGKIFTGMTVTQFKNMYPNIAIIDDCNNVCFTNYADSNNYPKSVA